MAKLQRLKEIQKCYSFPQSIESGKYIACEWREEKPVWDNTKCFKCGMCYLACPDAAIRAVEEGFFEADLEICKGCGICARQCWNGTITMVAEEK